MNCSTGEDRTPIKVLSLNVSQGDTCSIISGYEKGYKENLSRVGRQEYADIALNKVVTFE